jgi:hypothetical protein
LRVGLKQRLQKMNVKRLDIPATYITIVGTACGLGHMTLSERVGAQDMLSTDAQPAT